jgi:hypothetical protein
MPFFAEQMAEFVRAVPTDKEFRPAGKGTRAPGKRKASK